MMDRQAIGKAGEDFTCDYLKKCGMKILARNYRAKKGEIDVIARDGSTIVFVEVKTRSSSAYGTAGEAVTYRKQQMVARTAQWYIMQNHIKESDFRFDVAEVSASGPELTMNYLRNAFGV
ncbi:MAG: YraN family protein [Christensenella sp.]|uniref:YraN family protein n=1 Tax=Christensenella sp. TaxID=1935934 RepID=UPI002B20731D|nr:YraN family protein [Christensenella sp.]MEA5003075.1 YraN family protein [Christensenella sp.]